MPPLSLPMRRFASPAAACPKARRVSDRTFNRTRDRRRYIPLSEFVAEEPTHAPGRHRPRLQGNPLVLFSQGLAPNARFRCCPGTADALDAAC